MKRTLALILVGATMISAFPSQAEVKSTSHNFPAIEWNHGGEPPRIVWTPWLPLGGQVFVRSRYGFRLVLGNKLGVKAPVRLTFSYDTENAKSGKDLPIKVKAELIGADFNTFESAFGLSLPSEFQVGLIGISGIPDFLPWFTLPVDFCTLLNLAVSKVPSENVRTVVKGVCDLIKNLGVNMTSKEALPLGTSKEYHDRRNLIDFDLMNFLTKSEKEQVTNYLKEKVLEMIKNHLGEFSFAAAITAMAVAGNITTEQARERFINLVAEVVRRILNLTSLKLVGDPYFIIDGTELTADIRMYIPGRGSGVWPVKFTKNGEEQTITFMRISPFVQPGDKLIVTVDSLQYRFKLYQNLGAQVRLSVVDYDHTPPDSKFIAWPFAEKHFDNAESEFKLEIPLQQSNEQVQGISSTVGCNAVVVRYSSPYQDTKTSVQVYKNNALLNTVSEVCFSRFHNVMIGGLESNTTYTVNLSIVNKSGENLSTPSMTITTKSKCISLDDDVETPNLRMTWPSTQTTPLVSIGTDYADFFWETNRLANTTVRVFYYRNDSTTGLNYYKLASGEVRKGGFGFSSSDRLELTTRHSMRVTELTPNTKYYFEVGSQFYENDDVTKNVMDKVRKIVEATTVAVPVPSRVRIKVLGYNNSPQNNTTLTLVNTTNNAYTTTTTLSDGMTPFVALEPGVRYQILIKNLECYQDYTSPPTVIIPAGKGGDQPQPFVVQLAAKSSPPAFIFDQNGNPLNGAAVSVAGGPAINTGNTNSFSFDSNRFNSDVVATVSKPGFVPKQIAGKLRACDTLKFLVFDNVTMKSSTASIKVSALDYRNTPVAGAILNLKEGSNLLANSTTNNQGEATLQTNFADLNVHKVTISVSIPPGKGYKTKTSETEISAGETKIVFLNLEPYLGTITVKARYKNNSPLDGGRVTVTSGSLTVAEGVINSSGEVTLVVHLQNSGPNNLNLNIFPPSDSSNPAPVPQAISLSDGQTITIEKQLDTLPSRSQQQQGQGRKPRPQ